MKKYKDKLNEIRGKYLDSILRIKRNKAYTYTVIYGAGMFGQMLYRMLKHHKIKVDAFCVTEIGVRDKDKKVMGIPIYPFGYFSKDKALYIVGVSKPVDNEIIATLQKNNIHDYIGTPNYADIIFDDDTLFYKFCHSAKKKGIITTILEQWPVWKDKIYQKYLWHTSYPFHSDAKVGGIEEMDIGVGFRSGKGLWIETIKSYGTRDFVQHFSPKLIIGENVSLGEYVHIGSNHYIKIGNNVLTGSKVYITDHNHGIYNGEVQSKPDVPPGLRSLTEGREVIIEDNVWIGEFVTILPGVHIGKGSIIGSHSTVTHDIPAEVIAAGCPAKVIKKYNKSSGIWERK